MNDTTRGLIYLGQWIKGPLVPVEWSLHEQGDMHKPWRLLLEDVILTKSNLTHFKKPSPTTLPMDK
jgi:hypothetical protein